MLVRCPECDLQVSDKAVMCPHCGLPFKPNKISVNKSARKKRLPNGFGQITEIKGRNLRNPFRAMITVGVAENGRPICKLLSPKAYFPSYNDAYQALMVYNKEGYNPSRDTTFKMLYDEWSQKYYKDVSAKTVRSYTAAWKYFAPIYSSKVSEIKIKQLRDSIENATIKIYGKSREASSGTKKNMKIVLNLLYDYAIECEIIDKNYARSFSLSKGISKEASKVKKEHIPFTDKERNILWKHKKDEIVEMTLINCYTGYRPSELIAIKLENINFADWTITGGMKTDAGRDRIVPIHTCIRSLVKARYNKSKQAGSDYLFTSPKTNAPMTSKQHSSYFKHTMTSLGLNPEHRPHDARKDFITMAKSAKMDEYAIKRIVGHAIKDITEKVYTERNTEWLHEEIEKIKV